MMLSLVFLRFLKLMPGGSYFIPIFISFLVLPPEVWSQETMDQNLQEQRYLFVKAEKELITGAGERFYALRERLEDYPLSADLDYQVQMKALKNMTAAEARLFVSELDGTPLAGRFLANYLRHKSNRGRWADFLGVLDSAPKMVELQCRYYLALHEVGKTGLAFEGASKLWNVGFSQHSSCDPLFGHWLKAGGVTDSLVWSRALKAFDNRESHLIKYVKKYGSPSLRLKLNELLRVYVQPTRVTQRTYAGGKYNADIIVRGLSRLAKINATKVYRTLGEVRVWERLSVDQLRIVESEVIRNGLRKTKDKIPADWILERLERYAEDELTQIYLRKCIREGHSNGYLKAVSWLSPSQRRRAIWRYWEAKALGELGMSESAQIWNELSKERGFHGFLAAEHLDFPYALNQQSTRISSDYGSDELSDVGFLRAKELLALDRHQEAKEQWRHSIKRLPLRKRLIMGRWGLDKGWPDLATDAANVGGSWDRLDLRFPRSDWTSFLRAGSADEVSPFLLISIARRESALYPFAVSRAGALGLMQLMPATAKYVSRKRSLPYRRSGLFDPSISIKLGAAYYTELKKRYEGNRLLSLAAYNAGPARVDGWVTGDLNFDQWLDSLPYRETRDYVQAVMSYSVIYHSNAGIDYRMLNEKERLWNY